MVSVGDAAPGFTIPLTDIDGDIKLLTPSENFGDAPIVLVLFPVASTGACATEMRTFRDQMVNFEDVDTTMYGISTDAPSTLMELTEQNGLNFNLVSDTNREPVDAYGMAMDLADLDINRVAKHAVSVVDSDGEVTYAWISDDPGIEPDYKAVEATAGRLEAPNEAA